MDGRRGLTVYWSDGLASEPEQHSKLTGGPMLRRRNRWIVPAVLLALAFAFGTSVAQDADVAALEARITALENRIATLERTLAQRLAALERKVQEGGGASDAEADAAYAEVSQLMARGDYEQAKAKMADFMKTYGSTNTAKRARRTYEELSVIGKPIPETWSIEKWYQGQDTIDLASGKTTLLVFWEEWCPHCKREVPKLQEVYSHLHGDGLQMIGLTKITRSATDEKVKEFIAQNQIQYPIAKEDGNLSAYFNVSGIPAAAVIKDGKVVWRGHPAQLTEDRLKSWL